MQEKKDQKRKGIYEHVFSLLSLSPVKPEMTGKRQLVGEKNTQLSRNVSYNRLTRKPW